MTSNRRLGKPHRSEESTLDLHRQTVPKPPASQGRGPGGLARCKAPTVNGVPSSYSRASSTPLVLGILSHDHYEAQIRPQVQTAQTHLPLTPICTGLCCFLTLSPIPSPPPSSQQPGLPPSRGRQGRRVKQAKTGLLSRGGQQPELSG